MPGIRKELEPNVIDIVNVIGSGRVGSAIGARLRERGVAVSAEGVVLTVPDDQDMWLLDAKSLKVTSKAPIAKAKRVTPEDVTVVGVPARGGG